MKFVVVISCVLASALAKDPKISLDDIERDNLKSEKRAPSGSPTDFGFLPVKTAADYARQQPKQLYVQPQAPSQGYTPPPQKYTMPAQQYAAPQQYYYQSPNQYQQYENVQYVTDNSIAQQQQQYYTPQYVYLQQYTAPSTAIQSVVDPKGGVQYVMYIPTYVPKAEQTQTVPTIVYANEEAPAAPETQYVTKYVEQAPQAPAAGKTAYYTAKQQPKSLLDSYVPSVLQYQYYKQHQEQARANAIQESSGKVDFFKSTYRPTQTHGTETAVNYSYQVPSAYIK